MPHRLVCQMGHVDGTTYSTWPADAEGPIIGVERVRLIFWGFNDLSVPVKTEDQCQFIHQLDILGLVYTCEVLDSQFTCSTRMIGDFMCFRSSINMLLRQVHAITGFESSRKWLVDSSSCESSVNHRDASRFLLARKSGSAGAEEMW